VISKDLTRRTPAEDLWLWRRWRGYTQAFAAQCLACSRSRYQRMEFGLYPADYARTRFFPAEPGLLCTLARRRSGKPLGYLAQRLRISKPTLIAWERNGHEKLIGYWQSRGFTFAH